MGIVDNPFFQAVRQQAERIGENNAYLDLSTC